jgi:hypothetical protein
LVGQLVGEQTGWLLAAWLDGLHSGDIQAMVTNRRLAGWLSSDQKLECIWSCKCWLAGPHSDHKQAGWLTDWRAGLLAGWLARSIVLWSYTGSLSGWLDCIMVTNKLADWLAGQGAGRPIVEVYVPPQQQRLGPSPSFH